MPSVLVTGAARGIGKSIVERLASTGWDVIAGVRSTADADAITKVNPQQISAVMLDVTSADHIAKLPEALPDRLDAIVNNAGVVVAGAIETVSTDEWRKQLEINIIGQLAVTRAVLPKLRQSHGRTVFISSVNGKISTPLIGAYCASKFALEAAADALRVELRPWRIPVVLVEPAQTDTDIWRNADTMVLETEAAMSPEQRALYAKHIAAMKKFVPMSQRMAVPAEKVAAVVEEALTARRPRARYVVGLGPKMQTAFVTNLPTALRDRMIATMMRLPRG
ncbi:SDR family NAD(P)-dependent oxidoreductase [Mycobacterium hubeiense]|uniref:SDR family NAD(P)-dependent oxidoreductase n=1 Tax=Mycobacterium hubeiense TaxID=1867256 RepID=UPI000C7EA63C|nr:SDR family NAD(P)-dependent oxidoreductase [Mycobacterium sp. QGD 101]